MLQVIESMLENFISKMTAIITNSVRFNVTCRKHNT